MAFKRVPLGNNQMAGLESPGLGAVAITPSDDAADNLDPWPRALWVGGNGNVAFVCIDGTVVTFVGAVVGSIIDVAFVRINSTNTTATNLVGIY